MAWQALIGLVARAGGSLAARRAASGAGSYAGRMAAGRAAARGAGISQGARGSRGDGLRRVMKKITNTTNRYVHTNNSSFTTNNHNNQHHNHQHHNDNRSYSQMMLDRVRGAAVENVHNVQLQSDPVRRTMGALTLGMSELGYGVGGVAKRIHGFARGLSEGQRHLTAYNGQIALSFAELNLKRFHGEYKMGLMTAGSTTKLNRNVGRMEEAMAPYQAAATNAYNDVASSVSSAATDIINRFGPMLESVPLIGQYVEEANAEKDKTHPPEGVLFAMNKIREDEVERRREPRKVGRGQ